MLDVESLTLLRINEVGTLFYVHTFTPRSGDPIPPVELTPHAALAAAAAIHRSPVPPLPSESLHLGVSEIVDWEPYLEAPGTGDEWGFLLGLGI